ncbi:hypothetical protein KCP73_17375 [Salmonella enterica subsp. enterica]|nr:hypothetical protein KCP73_17375 [Salmonella enterica subsp. enterica]
MKRRSGQRSATFELRPAAVSDHVPGNNRRAACNLLSLCLPLPFLLSFVGNF